MIGVVDSWEELCPKKKGKRPKKEKKEKPVIHQASAQRQRKKPLQASEAEAEAPLHEDHEAPLIPQAEPEVEPDAGASEARLPARALSLSLSSRAFQLSPPSQLVWCEKACSQALLLKSVFQMPGGDRPFSSCKDWEPPPSVVELLDYFDVLQDGPCHREALMHP